MAQTGNSDWIPLIREESWDEFNARDTATPPQLANANLRGASFTLANLRGTSLRNAA